jgi:Dyp-type peroxidase family
MADTLDLQDIQGLIIGGYGNLRAACYILLAISNPHLAKMWLSTLTNTITNGQARPEEKALNVAFTNSGIKQLGLEPAEAGFSDEFSTGIATAHRSLLLGDIEENSPAHWIWGGPGTKQIDMVLMMFARDEHALSDMYEAHAKEFADNNGLVEVRKLDTVDLGNKEHFGFNDGISQPVIEGSGRTASSMHMIKAGEFLLGYPNEYGLYTDRPMLKPALDPENLLPHDSGGSDNKDLGRNGSYLVFRQLRQDVRGFWLFLDQATRGSDGSSDPTTSIQLAAQMVGRWPSGAPLLETLERDDPRPQSIQANDFTYYQTDPYGFKCPLGAHIRRANPRDSLDPQPGSEQSIAIGKRHRILRRGREYGPPLGPAWQTKGQAATGGDQPTPPQDEDRGLHFLCLNANIARQFEFIQHTWINNPHFNGLYDDADPLVGAHRADGSTFTIQAKPVRKRFTHLSRFVSVVGGAYFFMPGIRAIRYLASV